MNYSAEGKMERRDYIQLGLRGQPVSYYLSIFLFSLLAGFLLSRMMLDGMDSFWERIGSGMLGALVIFFIITVGTTYRYIRQVKMAPFDLQGVQFHINSEGICKVNNRGFLMSLWSQMSSVRNKSEYIFIMLDLGAVLIIPKRFFKSREEAEHVTASIQKEFEKNKKNKRKAR